MVKGRTLHLSEPLGVLPMQGWQSLYKASFALTSSISILYQCTTHHAFVQSDKLIWLQIEGAFIMGMGLCTMEEVLIDPKTGKLLSDSTWTYKIPTAADIPRNFNVTFLKNSPNIRSVMSSKASGEPSMMLSMSVLYALRRAVLAAKNSISEAATSCGAAAGSPALPQAEQESANGVVCDDDESVNGKAEPRRDAGQTVESGVASTKDQTSTSCVIDEGAGGNPFFVLEAPVTTCHGKEAMGQFSVVGMLKAAANKTHEDTAGLEYHSSGEWVVVH